MAHFVQSRVKHIIIHKRKVRTPLDFDLFMTMYSHQEQKELHHSAVWATMKCAICVNCFDQIHAWIILSKESFNPW